MIVCKGLAKQLVPIVAIILAVLSVGACTSTGNESDKPKNTSSAKSVLNYKKADQDYQKLVLQLKNNRPSPQMFDAIVRIYPLTAKYDPYDGIEQAQKLVANNAMDTGNWQQCLSATNAILNDNFTSLTGHYGAMVCHLESGNTSQGRYHKRMLDGFMDAVWRSGSGQTLASALYVTSANDLYAFIQLQNHIAVGQKLVYLDDKPIHAMSVKNLQNQSEKIWYFDVTAQFRRGILDVIEQR